MEGLIRETNENLKAIINTMKENVDSSTIILENIQSQMDKKVEEAKKYKQQVDFAKETISRIEEDNRNLEVSLEELNEKYSKLNLVSLIETGNKEIKAKINDNIREINKNKTQIAELTSKAKTIKELLINLKKDKTLKEERLENLKTIYEFYNTNLNEIIDYSYENIENLESFKVQINTSFKENNETYTELDNTQVFDEIEDIDDIEYEEDNNTEYNIEENIEENDINLEDLESTQVFDSIMYPDFNNYDLNDTTENEEFELEDIKSEEYEEDIEESEEYLEDINESEENIEDRELNNINNLGYIEDITYNDKNISNSLSLETEKQGLTLDTLTNENLEKAELEVSFDEPIEEIKPFKFNINEEDLNKPIEETTQFETFTQNIEPNELDLTTNNRIDEISDFLTTMENTKTENIELDIESKIDNVLKVETEEEPTILDIFGNPVKNEEINKNILQTKKIEELFVENGIDFHKFKEDEQNYLKQIYDEDKFINIFGVLNKHKINVDNLYNSFNIFGEINPLELDNIITKLLSIGQSVETIGIILEKMPKIKKYDLDLAINSFGDDIKYIDMTELIMKAKELYNGGK